MRRVPSGCIPGCLLLLLWSTGATADPWLAPGDPGLRSDVQLLADEGVVRAPVTSWPLSWADVVRDLDRVRAAELRTPSLLEAYERVKREALRQTRIGISEGHAELAFAEDADELRGFEDVPRERAEAEAGLAWIGDRFAARLQVQRVQEPADGKRVRLDGSYAGVVVGNVMISAGYMEKWWGPGWTGSLVLSSNARPVPSLTLERNYAEPFETPVLRWLGPWRASFQAGRLESARGDFARPHFIALRVAFKPAPALEIGLSRSAQLCGEGRGCGLGDYWNMAIGRDNDQSLAEQPGNQLAGFDARYSGAPRGVPLAVYAQAIGEDEAGYLPAKYLGLGGVEAWGRMGEWNVRGYVEFAKTSCDFARSQPLLGCAYESSIYTDGYRFRGRTIGHAWGPDASGWAVGATANRGALQLGMRLHDVRLASDAAGAAGSTRARGADVALAVRARWGRWRAGAGYQDAGAGARGAVSSGLRAFLEWRREV